MSPATATTSTGKLAYDPAIDGLRAIAVLVVMLYHADVSWSSGGFLGVDLFFVLSGFLITSLLIRELRTTGTVDLLSFWSRRLRRLVPALVLMVAWVVVYSRWIDPAAADSGVREDAVASLLYVANWYQIFSDTSYFSLLASPTPLLHTWSLAIEEQWYLFWPLVMVAWAKWGRAGGMVSAAIVAALALVSAIAMAALAVEADPSRAFYGTDTRAAGLLIGASLAFLLESDRFSFRVGNERPLPLTALSLVALAYAVIFIRDDDFFMYQGGFLAAAVVCALCIFGIRLSGPSDPIRRALSVEPLVWIGKLSYGLYLWHWPMFVWLTEARTGLSGVALVALRFAATIVPTLLSYFLVEKPIRSNRAPIFGPLPLTAGAVAVAAVAFLAIPAARGGDIGESIRITATGTEEMTAAAQDVSGADPLVAGPTGALFARQLSDPALPTVETDQSLVPSSEPTPSSDPGSQPAGPDAAPASPNPVPDPTSATSSPNLGAGSSSSTSLAPAATPSTTPAAAPSTTPAAAPSTTPATSPVRPPTTSRPATTAPPVRVPSAASILVLGDSVYLDLVMRVPWPISTSAGTRVSPTADVRLGCGTLEFGLNPTCADRLSSWRSSVATDRPDAIVVGVSSWDALDVEINGRTLALGSSEHTAMMVKSWRDNLDAVTATGAPVLVVSLPCLKLENAPDPTAPQRVAPDRTAHVNRTIKSVVDGYGGNVRWVELRDFTCPSGQYQDSIGGQKQHRDGIHFTDEAIPVLWSWLIERVAASLVN